MAITVGGVSAHQNGSNSSNTVTISGYTPPSGDDKIVNVCWALEETGGPTPQCDGMTYGGAAMTEESSTPYGSQNAIGTFRRDIGSSTTASDIVFDMTTTGGVGYSFIIFTIIGAAQQAAEATTSVLDTNTDDITTITNGAIALINFSTGGSTNATPGAGQTEIAENVVSGSNTFYHGVSYEIVATAGTATLNYTGNSGTREMLECLAFAEATGGVVSHPVNPLGHPFVGPFGGPIG